MTKRDLQIMVKNGGLEGPGRPIYPPTYKLRIFVEKRVLVVWALLCLLLNGVYNALGLVIEGALWQVNRLPAHVYIALIVGLISAVLIAINL